VLAGGRSLRMKPDIDTPKPLLEIKGSCTLLERQIKWLQHYNFDRVVLAVSREVADQLPTSITSIFNVELSVEESKLGTGGAARNALDRTSGRYLYMCNCDDIVFYDPNTLVSCSAVDSAGVSVLLGKARSPYGRVWLNEDYRIVRFEEKPILPYLVSLGHYCFDRAIVERYFPDQGDLERVVMGDLVQRGVVKGLVYDGVWLTVNNLKQYLKAVEYFKQRDLY